MRGEKHLLDGKECVFLRLFLFLLVFDGILPFFMSYLFDAFVMVLKSMFVCCNLYLNSQGAN